MASRTLHSVLLVVKVSSAASSITVALALLFALLLTVALPVRAQTLTTLYTFTGGKDGMLPRGGLVFDAQGNLDGTTLYGAYPNRKGGVFQLTPSRTEKVLYSFKKQSAPNGNLVLDSQGNLYGTTAAGGGWQQGTVFKVTPSGTEKVLHSFGGYRSKKVDGSIPFAGVIFDAQGNLYGTTAGGGNNACNQGYGCGLVFKLTPSGKETLLYKFKGGTDGWGPGGPLLFDKNGNLYGTTGWGGNTGCYQNFGCGTVFKLSPSGTETVLYRFTGGADGASPTGALVFDSQGNLYGTTPRGGIVNSNCSVGCGVVFKLTPSGAETVLYSFTGGADGASPQGGLAIDSQGNLYGVTADLYYGGSSWNWGTIFEVTPSGTETILHSFTAGADGANPQGSLIFDSQGNVYGTTYFEGLNLGTVFKLTP
jgi:uncharacterized repeat protein (TIGR03803 family)